MFTPGDFFTEANKNIQERNKVFERFWQESVEEIKSSKLDSLNIS